MNYDFLPEQVLIKYGCENYRESMSEDGKYCFYSGLVLGDIHTVPTGCREIILVDPLGDKKFFCPEVCAHSSLNLEKEKTLIWGVRFLSHYEIADMDSIENDIFSEEEDFFKYISGNAFEKEIHKTAGEMRELIIESDGSVSLEELSERLSYGVRYLNMIFKEAYLCGPKDFCKTVRFQKVLKYMTANPKKSNLEYMNGLDYYDQAHFQKEFRNYTGMTPKQFCKFIKPLGEF